jgi:hypothetical protein
MTKKPVNQLLIVLALTFLRLASSFSQTPRDLVKGNLIQFNDNGGWCWYQDERAVIDIVGGKLLLGSDGSSLGVGGSPRSGDVEAVLFDLKTRSLQRFTLKEGNSIFYCDDHNAPAFLVRPDRKYLAFYAAHFNDTSSHYRVFDGSTWGSERLFDWKKERPGGANFQTTYSNLWYLAAEGRLYNFVRGNNKSPNIMVSTDMGETWVYGGQLTTNANVGYNNGYYKYWGNGVDRIDFICSDYHPRDFPTSIFHGYIKNTKVYKSDGTLVDDNVLDTLNVPTTAKLTLVFADSTVVEGVAMRRCWNTDVQRYDDGTIATIITARANNNQGGSSTSINPDLRFLYARFDGSKWTTTYLGKAGSKLYASEQDYTGLGAMHPNDPNTIYISTPFDPRDNTSLGVHEIFQGVTFDQGKTWTWTPITQKSVRDNLRPVVPVWDKDNTALLWWRGTYSTAQIYNGAIVGILDRQSETVGLMRYVDATEVNTTLADGSSLATTGPDSTAGVADGRWHLRLGVGNSSTVLASAEVGGEDAQTLRTRVEVPGPGTYDVLVNFWGVPTTSADWRVKAGLSLDRMQLFRSTSCKEVEDGDHDAKLTLSGTGNTFLYQAYLGRVEVSTSNEIDVFVDDEAVRVGTTGPTVGDNSRTWYDGVSYAKVNTVVSVQRTKELPITFGLNQNYPNPFNASTVISYQLPAPRGVDGSASGFVTLKVFDMLGRDVVTLENGMRGAGTHSVIWDASGHPSGIYLCRLQARGSSGGGEQVFTDVKRMVLVK